MQGFEGTETAATASVPEIAAAVAGNMKYKYEYEYEI
jgi:hypothetical protein